ncbi:conserved hypothetical protein [delta proteobacterium NaphS2]|nr:conserved hypothetical protein [delta proteobacterium NaphS2]
MSQQDEKEIKLNAFNQKDVSLFCEEMEEDSWALRAFGVLLESSSLDYFSDEVTTAASQYRRGLRNIVELYLDRQEQKLNALQSRNATSPEWFIENAEVMCKYTRQGCFNSPEVALEHVRQEIQRMNQVIATFGADEYPKAQKVLEDLLDLQDGIKARIEVQKVAKDLENSQYKFIKAAAKKKRETEEK